MKIIARGAEAVLFRDGIILIKRRVNKSYRHPQLDGALIKKRTKFESRILEKISTSALINVPRIIGVEKNEIKMDFISGVILSNYFDSCSSAESYNICKEIGKQLATLHKANIIHGDLTTSNMIWKNKKLYFIDFGLSFHSTRPEDKAVDFHLLAEAFRSKHFRNADNSLEIIKKEYIENYSDATRVLKQLKKVKMRGRYKKRQKRKQINQLDN